MTSGIRSYLDADWTSGIPNESFIADHNDEKNLSAIAAKIPQLGEYDKKMIGEKCWEFIDHCEDPQKALRMASIVKDHFETFGRTKQIALIPRKDKQTGEIVTPKIEVKFYIIHALKNAIPNLYFPIFESKEDIEALANIIRDGSAPNVSTDQLIRIFIAIKDYASTDIRKMIRSIISKRSDDFTFASINKENLPEILNIYNFSKESSLLDRFKQYLGAANEKDYIEGIKLLNASNIPTPNLIEEYLIKNTEVLSDHAKQDLNDNQLLVLLNLEYGIPTNPPQISPTEWVKLYELTAKYKGFETAKNNLTQNMETLVKSFEGPERFHIELAVSIAKTATKLLGTYQKVRYLDTFLKNDAVQIRNMSVLESLLTSIYSFLGWAIPAWIITDRDFVLTQLAEIPNLELDNRHLDVETFNSLLQLRNLTSLQLVNTITEENFVKLPLHLSRIAFSEDQVFTPGMIEYLKRMPNVITVPRNILYKDAIGKEKIAIFNDAIVLEEKNCKNDLFVQLPLDRKFLEIPVATDLFIDHIVRMQNLEGLTINLEKINPVKRLELFKHLQTLPNFKYLSIKNTRDITSEEVEILIYNSNIENLKMEKGNFNSGEIKDFKIDRNKNNSKIKEIEITGFWFNNQTPFKKALHNLQKIRISKSFKENSSYPYLNYKEFLAAPKEATLVISIRNTYRDYDAETESKFEGDLNVVSLR